MSTRYTNAVANDTFEPPFTFKKDDGTEGISIPPHVGLPCIYIYVPRLIRVCSLLDLRKMSLSLVSGSKRWTNGSTSWSLALSGMLEMYSLST